MNLEGTTALVTSASRNIGQGIAEPFAERGADVGLTAREDRKGCEETARRAEAHGPEAAVALADFADPEAIDEMVATIRADLGPIDVLVNNATYRPSKPFLDVTLEDLEAVHAVNVRGVIRTTQQVLPDMLENGGGAIVNLIGAMVYLGAPGHVHSYGTKFAIEGLVRQLATEFGPDGVRVNGLSPGLIDTDRGDGDSFAEIERQIVEATPVRRTGDADEVADGCCCLASDAASFVAGQVLHVNGGTYPTPTLFSLD
jgi:3-oxoacyl-[acyl-carrier protein] reductase